MGGRGGGKLVMLLSTPFPHLLLLRPRPPQLRLGRHLPTSLRHLPSTPPLLPFPLATTPPANTSALFHTQAAHTTTTFSDNHHQQQPQPPSALPHPWPWPEWTSFLQLLSSRGYFDRFGVELEGDAFAPLARALPPQFMREATACLLFARDRPDLLRSLSRKDIEVVVENGTASLFINAMDSANRWRSFLAGNDFDVLEAEKVGTIDLMRYLLTYAANQLLASHEENFKNKDIVELSVRNLINGLVGLFRSSEGFSFSESYSMQPREVHVQSPGSFRQGNEMKRGDWICPKCNFMNFARNMKCLDCKVDRPSRNLTGREWECPRCNFLNYGRNTVCLRCDCQRSGESFSSVAAFSNSRCTKESDTKLPLTGNISNQAEIERRLAANDEKAERWFSKMSQLDNVSDMSSAIADEDFPEIMPLRKGVNRFVVSTRKTPLERRLANAQYRKNLGNGGAPEADGPQSPTTSSSSSITESLDRILGQVTQASEKDKSSLPHVNASFTKGNSSGRDNVNTSVFDQNVGNQRRNDSYVPFVPFPKDMFSQNQSNVSKIEEVPKITEHFTAPKSIEPGNYDKTFLTENPKKTTEEKSVEQGDKAEWHEKSSQVNDVSDLASTVSDDDFPEIMPMRRGENRFVVGKKKDRSLTSPQYKRRLAMEQANSSNYVPFVPFPPDYFAKKDKLPEAGDTASSKSQSSNISELEPLIQSLTAPKPEDNKTVGPNWGVSHDKSVNYKNEEMNKQHQESGRVLKFGGDTGVSSAHGSSPANAQHSNDQPSPQPSGNSLQYATDSSDKRGFTGKSLEGSAVTEPDPLDMSEEAKAARWFRRVQQINDISELANIPDEDFPSIMPMRKGVNRFVVSKRKTPLERRLTSPKYRRDLPIFSSEPKQMPPPDSEGSN